MIVISEQNYPLQILFQGFCMIVSDLYARIQMKGIKFANVRAVSKW